MESDVWELSLRLALAAGLSGLVGFEREAARKAAGLRTNMLVGLGAALFAILSLEGFDAPDHSRIAAQVVTGVGFLGAGAIFRQGANIQGLTTAASLWAVAAIGLAAGAGELALATVATALGLVVLYGLSTVERVMRTRTEARGALLDVHLSDVAALGRVLKLVRRLDAGAEVARLMEIRDERGSVRLRLNPALCDEIGSVLLAIEGVDRTQRADP